MDSFIYINPQISGIPGKKQDLYLVRHRETVVNPNEKKG
jgi:hypothetical protein